MLQAGGQRAQQAKQAATQAAAEAAPQGIQAQAAKNVGFLSTDSETLTNEFRDAFDSTKKGFFEVTLLENTIIVITDHMF